MLLLEVPLGDDGHRGAVVELQLPGSHYLLAALQAFEHHRQAFAALADPDEAALDDPLRLALVILRHLALLVLLLPDDVDRVAVEVKVIAVSGTTTRCSSPGNITSRLANMPGSSLPSGFSRAARTCRLRVSLSTLGLMAAISASNTWPG